MHLDGTLVDLRPLRELATVRGLFVLGDAAQAHGARRGGRDVGALGDAAAFSFYPAKNLGAFGDGGVITTADAALAQRARGWGATADVQDDRYRFDEQGVNSRLDPLQAAALRVKLAVLDAWNERRRRHAEAYLRDLAGRGGADASGLDRGRRGVRPPPVLRSPTAPRAASGAPGRAGDCDQIHIPSRRTCPARLPAWVWPVDRSR